ncbi:MAG TPA: dTDP-4-dehydrorhamnose reductase [Solirubrobacteraceae bacterium]|jgi:dTDP-4-dehydrorhamnose reductase|nr:dTDP-4-dehydrorhamnose reductase [Solirubrobacteraceae bacterium]
MRVLVAGAGGMLGLDVLRAGERAGHELVGADLPELDITDAADVQGALERVRPDAVLNCAAWTDVDGAETHIEQAHAVNADGAGKLARAAAGAGVPLVHVSTDYVFSGEACVDSSGAPRAYVESDPTGPRSVYGQSKLAGEQQVLSASPAHTVVRSAWLFGVGGRNFAETMLRLAAERTLKGTPSGAQAGEGVQVVTDQVGCPTWTGHLAPALLGLIERGVAGLVHLAGAGRVSWNGFTVEIFRQAEVDWRVEDATSAQMQRPAPRPAWSVLESERDDVLPLPPWQDGLSGYLAARGGVTRA